MAENIVAQWLMSQGWTILHRRWHCRWGELDLVAYSEAIAAQPCPFQAPLSFVEVKARRSGNWDANGLLAVSSQKQIKLWRTAKAFLAAQPQLSEVPCRFDVALVRCEVVRSSSPVANPHLIDGATLGAIQIGQPIVIAPYRLSIQQYVQNAFNIEA
nr:YraN family protein [Oculatella sp. LEGE 06141]